MNIFDTNDMNIIGFENKLIIYLNKIDPLKLLELLQNFKND